jgi:hypothetical protein
LASVPVGGRLVTVSVVVNGRSPPSLSITAPRTIGEAGPSARIAAGTLTEADVDAAL